MASSRENCSEHQTTMFSSLHEKQKVGKYCDVLLKCADSDQTFNAHSCVLSAASSTFDKILQDAMDERDKNPSTDDSFLKLKVDLPGDVASSCVESLLNFIYSGNVDLNIMKENPVKPDVRKSRRNSGSNKSKTMDDAAAVSSTDDSGIEISSLYNFLKASRCLGIKTLTEHLESAATLAKMKTGSSTDMGVSERPPRRASAVKFQNSLRSSIEEEKEEIFHTAEMVKSPKSRKRRQVSEDNQKQTATKTQKGKPRSAKKTPTRKRNSAASNDIVVDETQVQHPDQQSDDKTENGEDSTEKPVFAADTSITEPVQSQSSPTPITPECNMLPVDSLRAIEAVAPLYDVTADGGMVKKAEDTVAVGKTHRRKATRPSQVTKSLADASPGSNNVRVGTDEDKIKSTKSSIFKEKRRKKRAPSKISGPVGKREVPDGPAICDQCGKVFASSRVLANHTRSHGRAEISCTFCSQKFKYKSALKRHLLWHTGDGQTCPVCQVPMFSQRELSQHMTTHSLRKMRTQCTLCQKWFTSSYVMQLHMRTHTGDELFSCEICKKKFPYKSSLKMHMLLHTGEKAYMCSHCGKSFTQKIHAKEHELQHTGYKRFMCGYCERYFAHKCGLLRHISDIHHKNRPFVCETCGKSFPRKTKLMEHTRIHTGEKPYICDICGVKYKANRSLKSHKKNKHQIEVPNYEVGIWKGPLPPSPHKVKAEPKSNRVQKRISTFSFPITYQPIEEVENVNKEEENIINNIAEEVDVISTDAADQQNDHGSPISDGSAHSPRPTMVYQSPQHSINVSADSPGNTSITESTDGVEASSEATITKPMHGTLLPAFPSLQDHNFGKTYIVPLNAEAGPTLSVLSEQTENAAGPGQVPGRMMLTYMMPAQSTIQTSEVASFQPTGHMESPSHTLEMSRSASVPPMSTFRRHSTPVTTINAAEEIFSQPTSQTSLPGMHTFQSVAKTCEVLPNFTTTHAGLPVQVFVPATHAVTESADIHVTSQQPEPVTPQAGVWQEVIVEEITAEES